MTADELVDVRLGGQPVHDGRPEADHASMDGLADVDPAVVEHLRTELPVEAVQRIRVDPVGPEAEAHDVSGTSASRSRSGAASTWAASRVAQRQVTLDHRAVALPAVRGEGGPDRRTRARRDISGPW